MAHYYAEYATTPTNWVADTKAQILNSADWANITGNIVKATTTRGAQMVVDLNKSAPVNNYATISVWRNHNGSSGNDEVTRYLHWKYTSGGSTSNALHCMVSASKEHLVLQVEGPYPAESNTDTTDTGSKRSTLVIADIVPYHGSDTIPAVAMFANNNSSQSTSTGNMYVAVSRDQGDASAWVQANIATLSPSFAGNPDLIGTTPLLMQHVAKGDGNTYLFPFVVIETVDGIRGRLDKVFWAGWNKGAVNFGGEAPGLSEGSIVTYNSEDYVIRRVTKGLTISSSQTTTPFGSVAASNNYAYEPMMAIKKA